MSPKLACSCMLSVPARQPAVTVPRLNGRVSHQHQARCVFVHAEYSPSVDAKEGSSSIMCTAPVEAGEVLVSVPESEWLSINTVASSSIGSQTKAETGDPDWGAYCAQSKQIQPAVVLWSEEDLQELQGTQVLDTAMQYRKFFAAQHANLAPVLEQIGGGMPQACTADQFMLAAAVVRAKLLPIFPMDAPALIPGLQALAHSRNPSVQISVKTQGIFEKKKSLVVAAARDLSAGEVLSVDMAPGKLDSRAVLDHGVYDEEAPNPGYILQLSLPDEESDRCYYDKMDILEGAGMGTSCSFTLVPRQAPSPDMIAFLRLMNIQGVDSFLMESVFRQEAWGFMQDPVSEENEKAMCESIVAGCEAAVAAYPTSLADDLGLQASMKAADTSPRALALRVRMDEKEVLEGVMEWFGQRLQRLDKLEYYQERRLRRLGLLDDDGSSTFEDMVQINV